MILCDTNILIEFYKGNPATIQALRDIGQASIAVSVITKAELLFGARDKQELAKINRHLACCHCYPLTTDISDLFIGLMADYSLSHRPSIPDMLIAATALNYNLELYTLNTKDFKFIPNMRLYSAG
jgi:tRNA(fMet)-specific endonuclease VapC